MPTTKTTTVKTFSKESLLNLHRITSSTTIFFLLMLDKFKSLSGKINYTPVEFGELIGKKSRTSNQCFIDLVTLGYLIKIDTGCYKISDTVKITVSTAKKRGPKPKGGK